MNGIPWAQTPAATLPSNGLWAELLAAQRSQSSRLVSRLKLASCGLAVTTLAFLGAENAQATSTTWTGASGTSFEAAGNWNNGTPVAANSIIEAFFPSAVTTNLPTLTANDTIGDLGFAGAGWTIGGSASTYTLKIEGNPLALGIGGNSTTTASGTFVLGSTGAGTNTIDPNVNLSNNNGQANGIFVDQNNTLSLLGTLTMGAASTWTFAGLGTLDVAGATTLTNGLISQTGMTANLDGFSNTSTVALGAYVFPGTTGTVLSTINITGGTYSSAALNMGVGTLDMTSTATGFTSGAISLYYGATLDLADTEASGTAYDIGAAITTTIYTGANLTFDDSTNNYNRINTPGSGNAITLDGGELTLIGNASAAAATSKAYLNFNAYSAETITLTSNGGAVDLTDSNTTNTLTPTASINGGTLLIQSNGTLGAAGTGGADFILTTAPVQEGGLVPYAIGDTTGTGQGNTFLSYNATTGFTPVASTVETIASGSSANVEQTSNDSSMTGSEAINSLYVNGGGLTTTLTGTLTLTSGDFLATSGATGDTLTGGTIAGVSGDRLYFYVEKGTGTNQDSTTDPDLTVSSTISMGSDGFTKSGLGTMELAGSVTGNGGIDVAEGTLILGAANIFGSNNSFGTVASPDTLYVGSGATFDMNGYSLTIVDSSRGFAFDNNQTQDTGIITNNNSSTPSIINVGNGTNPGYIQTADRFTGNLGFVVNSGSTLYFQTLANPSTLAAGTTINTFTGGITVNQGGILIGADAQFGAYSGALLIEGGEVYNQGNNAFNAARTIDITSGTTTSTFQSEGALGLTFNDQIAFTTPGTAASVVLQSDTATVSTLAANIIFASTTANSLPTDTDLVLGANAAFLTVGFSSNQTLGSLATGTNLNNNSSNAAYTNPTETAIGLTSTATANDTLTVGTNNTSTTYSGVLYNGVGGTTGSDALALVKTGTGIQTLSGENSYSGGTTINQGEIDITGASFAGSSESTNAANTVKTNTISVASVSGLVLGETVTGIDVPLGSYITSINGTANTFTINANTTTAIPSSTVLAFGAYSGLGSGPVAVGAASELSVDNNYASGASSSPGGATSAIYGYSKGGSLGTQGLVPGGLTLSGGTLNLGTSYGNTGTASLGTITTATLTLNSGSMINYQIGGGTNSFIAVTGALSLNGATTVELYTSYADGATPTNASQTAPGVYDLMGYGAGTGALNTSLLTVGDQTAGYTYTFVQDSADDLIQLDVAAVPEPSTWMLFLGGMGMLAFWQRRRGAAGQA